jgi:hypothetical protein
MERFLVGLPYVKAPALAVPVALPPPLQAEHPHRALLGVARGGDCYMPNRNAGSWPWRCLP